MADVERKRAAESDSEDEDVIGPMPAPDPKPKKKKMLEFEPVYLQNLPSAEGYEKSYMHRDVITHLVVTETNFLVTASCDGHIKFWKKQEEGIEFVKHFKSHLGSIQGISASADGQLLCSVASDKSMKVFDVINFDMINMLKLNHAPGQCEWVFPR
ncbi:predicted protein, partial [Nematostella vectensis]